jgi:hypothetical protein
MVCALVEPIHAQYNTLSPYSIYGLGDEPNSSLASMAAVSHTGIAMLSTLNINGVNPATQTFVSRPTFNLDLRNEFLLLNAGGQQQANSLFSIENISLAFPVINSPKKKRNATVSFGLRPYSRQGYEVISREEVEGLGLVEYQFVGEGGVNDAFLTGSYDIIADSGKINTLSIGVTGSYVFGYFDRNRITVVDSNVVATNLYREDRNEVSAFDIKFGALYTRKLTFKDQKGDDVFGSFSVGGFFKPSMTLNGSARQTAYTFVNNPTNPVVVDTIQTSSGGSPITTPSQFGLGIGFTYDNRWNVGLDLISRRWSELEINGANANLNDAFRASLGVEYTPDPTAFKQLLRIVRYRAGFSFEQTRLNVNGTQPNQIGLSAGLGIPVIATRSTSMVNIGTEYVVRGGAGLPVAENFFNLYVGFAFTPNQYDRWFAKRKYD